MTEGHAAGRPAGRAAVRLFGSGSEEEDEGEEEEGEEGKKHLFVSSDSKF